MTQQRYQRLDGSQPMHPPLYDEIQPTPPMEQFEIEDGESSSNLHLSNTRHRLLGRASLITKKFASNINRGVIRPVTQMIDPIYEGYKYFNMQYEQAILKLGNPLVVKRLLYVFFIMLFIFFLTKYNVDGSGQSSGGAFSLGKLYDIEKLAESFESMVDVKTMKEHLEYFLSMPHLAGTKGDLALARYMESYMKNNGIRTIDFNEIGSFVNYPSNYDHTYVRLNDGSFQAQLLEKPEGAANDAMQYHSYNPNAMNTNGEIRGQYIYANYGTEEDFQKLKDGAIDLAEKILLVRYGGSIPNSNKVKLGKKYGAAAIIFISNSFETGDGVVHDDIIERVNVGLERFSTGDVLTPGWSSGEGYVIRLPWFKSETTAKIPTVPISYKDGQELLKRLKKGVKFGKQYSGASEEIQIAMKITNEQREVHPIWNVVGSIEGREQPEKGLIIGASRDSTCFGTMGTNTGLVILMELIKIFTALQRKFNWSPSRSIYFASFDGSEYNLAGLTEWIESRQEQLKRQGFAYIDLSDLVTGDILEVKSHPFLKKMIKDVLGKVSNGDSKSLLDLLKSQNSGNEFISNNFVELKNYIPFINLLNIPAIEVKFSGTKPYPKSSCMDNFQHFEKAKIDPDMKNHKLIVQVLSRLILELAEQPLIPYNINDLATDMMSYIKDIENYTNEVFGNDEKSDKPAMEFVRLENSIQTLMSAAERFQQWSSRWKLFVVESGDVEPSLLAMNRWKENDNLVDFNSKFISDYPQKYRPGYVNLLFGVSFGAPESVEKGDTRQWNTFPSIRDYLDTKQYTRALNDLRTLSNLMEEAASEILRP